MRYIVVYTFLMIRCSNHMVIPQLSVTLSYFNGSPDDPTETLSYTKDDAWIQSTYYQLRNDGTAKSNTDFLVNFDTTEAAHFARQQNISSVGQLDLPNLYELIILYLESDNIDAFDPTVESNRDKALGMMNTYGRFNFNNQYRVWSSTEFRYDAAYRVSYRGDAYGYNQGFYCGVAPAKEL